MGNKVMNAKIKRYAKIAVTVVIVGLFVWFLLIYPLVSFRKYEKQMTDAAERYFVIKPGELPTGERIKTLTLQDLFFGSYIKEDFYIPYTKEPCSLKDSWVKVRKENGEYKYYTYLKCGILSSTVDHKGPVITLEGDENLTVSKGEKFEDPGIKSVVDNKDGKLNTKDVTISGSVDTSTIGSYEIKYTAVDSLSNVSTITRNVEVVEKLKATVKNAIGNKESYDGAAQNNYIYFSNMLFRILDIDGDNVRIVSNYDIANVNYSGIENWLNDVFYDHLTSKSKELIVENKYCNMKGDFVNYTATKCDSYTGKKKVYIPSVVDVNKANSTKGNFMKPSTMSWVADVKSDNEGYIVRNFYVEGNINFLNLNKKYNFGVRPIITIKGDTLIKSGDGTIDKPYYLGDVTKGKVDSLLNERQSGEYIELNGYLYRIIETESDGTTKVIAENSLVSQGSNVKIYYENGTRIYDPTQKGNVGYYINNKASDFIDASYFVNKNIEVPIYKNEPTYKKESSTKKYKVKFSAPNTYDMFSAGGNVSGSYWLINSSKDNDLTNGISEIGAYMYGESTMNSFGVRLVGYLNKNVSIVSGNGTYDNPYKISK